MDHLAGIMRRRRILGDTQSQALAAYANAKDIFLQRFTEAGGQTCQ
jgi:hypothetical protein